MSVPSGGSNVAVFGLGYVGCVTAACLARLGHRVTGVDKDPSKVRAVMEKRAPFYEPGLETIVEETVAAGLLRATSSAAEALADVDVVLLCVGTPSAANGNLSLDQLRQVTEEVASALPKLARPPVVAVRSTVFPGTCEEVVIPLLAASGVSVVSNPEFLREGAAVQDFVEPALVVVGGSDRAAVERVAALYATLSVEPCLVSLRTAEMIKYACNAFHAVKISFANEIGALGHVLDIDAREVMDTLCRDHRLNISKAYLKPGFAFGGSCLPKDLRALNYRAGRLDVKLPMLSAVMPSNDEHLRRATNDALNLPNGRIGVIGLAFKENTDDLRESPVVTLLENLIGKGRELRVWDPHIRMDSIYGSNRSFLMNAIPHIGRLMEPTLENLLGWAQHVVVTQNPGAALCATIAKSGLPVLDLVGAIAQETHRAAGGFGGADRTPR
jgi:GDP-mannose 6-dehydrogenase